jgi:hypothetical protein
MANQVHWMLLSRSIKSRNVLWIGFTVELYYERSPVKNGDQLTRLCIEEMGIGDDPSLAIKWELRLEQ